MADFVKRQKQASIKRGRRIHNLRQSRIALLHYLPQRVARKIAEVVNTPRRKRD